MLKFLNILIFTSFLVMKNVAHASKNTDSDSSYNNVIKYDNTDKILNEDKDTETKYENGKGINSEIKRFDESDSNNKEFNESVVTNEGEGAGNETEPCVGAPQYCGMSRDEYVSMLLAYIAPRPYEWAFVAVCGAVLCCGLVGNALVCLAVFRSRAMQTLTNCCLVNLAVADLLVLLLCLPSTVLWDVTETWFLGEALCKILLYFQSVSVTVSVLTLTFISVDRWYAICFPLKFKSTTSRAKTAILIIWIVSLIFNSPELVVLTTVRVVPLRFELPYLVQCMPTWGPAADLAWHLVKLTLIYTLPLLLMCTAYRQITRVLWRPHSIPGQADTAKLAHAEYTQLRSRRKAAKMLVAVVAMFAICYFPVHLLSVLRYTVVTQQSDGVTLLALVSHALCYANSAVNPLIYNFMSDKFRREFRRVFCCNSDRSFDNFNSLTAMTTSKSRKNEDCPAFDLKCQVRTRSCRDGSTSSGNNKNHYYA